MEHDLKCWPKYYEYVASGDKTFEVRRNDRDFRVGDTLLLREYEPTIGEWKEGTYTGRSCRRRVTYVMHTRDYVLPGNVVLGIAHVDEPTSFQARVAPWMIACFGATVSADRIERNHRFLEESLELVQALGCTADEAHQLVDYVFSRPVGEPRQECGGVMVTLAALCLANGLNMALAGDDELARVWGKIEQIRSKQAAKPKHSPLPQKPEYR